MKLSVITINRNNKSGLEKTVSSVLSQSYSDYEYIIIDGGSTDGSVDIISANEDHIDYWVSEPDEGIYDAMNKGIRKAKGEYLYFLNSGDYLLDNNVFSQVFNEESVQSFIVCNYHNEKNGNIIEKNSYINWDWNFCLYDIYHGFLCHQAFFIRKDNFVKYGLYDINYIVSDWKLFLEAIGYNHEEVKYIDLDLVVYNVEGISSKTHPEIIHTQKREIIKKLFSPTLCERLIYLDYLESQSFWVNFVFSRKWIHFVQRRFVGLCKILGIVKKQAPYF